MTEASRVAAPRAVELDQLLLDTKLTIPQVKSGFVRRASLIDAARLSDRRVIAVSAPAGYGKSVLLAQWAETETRRVGWVSLDRFDDDPATLLTLLASAFVRATGAASSLVNEMRGHADSALGRAAPRLASALGAADNPFVLILDDLQELDSPACHDVLSVVIGGVPPGSQFAAASRSEQPHVPRLRASGETFEIGPSELALDVAGAEHIFAEARVPLPPEQAAMIIAKTEGWPVGLFLAATIARDNRDAPISVFGDDRYLADYLYRESLASIGAEGQRFLRRTAVLERFSADVCDAVMGGRGSQARLQDLESANVFLTPLDRQRRWYRYHPLFREFLLGELRRIEPDSVPDLHRRAADWYEANGSPAMAVEHLLQTPDRDRCVQLVASLALSTYQAGHLETVRRWLTELGDPAVAEYPPLAVLAAWIGVISGHAIDAERWARLAEDASFEALPADGSASFESGRAMLRSIMCPTGPIDAAADAALSVAQEPIWSPWRAQAVCLLAEAHLLAGESGAAEPLFSEAAQLAGPGGNHNVQVLADTELAIIAMRDSRWVEAAGLIQSALAAVDAFHLEDNAFTALALAAETALSLHRGEPNTSRWLARAMRGRQFCTAASPSIAVRTRLLLARAHLMMGDHATARHLVHEIDDIMIRRPNLGAIGSDVTVLRDRLVSTSVTTVSGAPLTPAELRLLPYLQTHLMIVEIGERLFISRNTVSTEVRSIYRKLGATSRSEAVRLATEQGLLGH